MQRKTVDTALAFYWRSGLDSADIDTNIWNGPYYATVGMNVVDSFALSGTGRMFQYKAEFRGSTNDIAVLYEVWVTYECSPISVEEVDGGAFHGLPLQFVNGRLILYLPKGEEVGVAIYDVTGRIVKNVFRGFLPSGVHEFEVPEKPGVYFARFDKTGRPRISKFITINAGK